MMTKYTFLGDGSIFFDEEKNVAELLRMHLMSLAIMNR